MVKNRTEAEISTVLVTRIIAGDTEAEHEMVERYNRGMVYMLRHRSNNPALADDLAQETWRIIIEKVRAGDLRDHSKLAAYIIQTAKNQLLMYCRSSHQTRITDEIEVDETPGVNGQPQEFIDRQNIANIVRQLLSELKTPRDRDLIMRFYLQEEDKSCLCDEYGLSELHFNRVLFRARKRFKQLWEKYIEGDND